MWSISKANFSTCQGELAKGRHWDPTIRQSNDPKIRRRRRRLAIWCRPQGGVAGWHSGQAAGYKLQAAGWQGVTDSLIYRYSHWEEEEPPARNIGMIPKKRIKPKSLELQVCELACRLQHGVGEDRGGVAATEVDRWADATLACGIINVWCN